MLKRVRRGPEPLAGWEEQGWTPEHLERSIEDSRALLRYLDGRSLDDPEVVWILGLVQDNLERLQQAMQWLAGEDEA